MSVDAAWHTRSVESVAGALDTDPTTGLTVAEVRPRAVTLCALLVAPGLEGGPSTATTMAFVVMSLRTVLSGLVLRRDPASGIDAPVLGALRVLAVPTLLTVAAVELGFLQQALGTAGLSGAQWLTCLALACVVPVVIEVDKRLRRGREAVSSPTPAPAR
ncbi:membrane hypothetical protein [Nostocoides japonicum T1-X7]|uniref:Cation-transporting P-type ATPase C-terminal domain-containing protein n=1 Tax=Nostocoides japonicum T1-X7 TaxID=1194083 RepID=A0A077LV73_9MICO|nr:cation transporting ATPase C-terminal domain-containing protein [Tetrasphaera japonica]CCH77833.1 membrane hypothetical protein [Tetrasphaera japonica T1-X7]